MNDALAVSVRIPVMPVPLNIFAKAFAPNAFAAFMSAAQTTDVRTYHVPTPRVVSTPVTPPFVRLFR